MRKTLTWELKKEITKKWHNLFPSMAIYKNMWLINICEPLAVGILLETKSFDKTSYTPCMHIHNLCTDDISVSLNLSIATSYIYAEDKNNKYLKMAEELKEKTYISFENDVNLIELIDNLKNFFISTYDKANLLKVLADISVWSGSKDIYEDVNSFIKNCLKDYPDMFGSEKVKKEWYESLPKGIEECEKLRAIVKEQKIKLKLTKLPHRKIII